MSKLQFNDYINSIQIGTHDTNKFLLMCETCSNKEIVMRVLKIKSRCFPKEQYSLLKSVFITLYKVKPNNDLLMLIQAMYDLDTKCSTHRSNVSLYQEQNTYKSFEEQSQKEKYREKQRLLVLLDNDLLLFKKIYHEYESKISTIYKPIFIHYARLVFKLNSYSAPPRSDSNKEYQDKIGQTDLFTELILA